jgi:GntR family transcriptional regulator
MDRHQSSDILTRLVERCKPVHLRISEDQGRVETNLITGLSERIRRYDAPREDLARRVARAIRDEIASGRLKPGTQLANEVTLAQGLSIIRPTLREAIRILGREGLLRIKHGVGTFVAEERHLIWGRLDSMRSMTDLIRSVGGKPGDRNLSVSMVPADPEVAGALDLAASAEVALVERVRLINNEPLALAAEFVAVRNPRDFTKLKRFRGGSLYSFLRDSCGMTLSHSSVVIAAVPAGKEQAALLELKRGTPLLLLRETHFDSDGRPVLFTVNHHNSEVVEFTMARAGFRT